MKLETRVTRTLDENHIFYRIKKHSKPVFTSEAAAAERKVNLGQIIKTMVLIDKKGNIIIALLPGNKRLNLRKISKLTQGEAKLTSPKITKKITGYEVGAISPIGLKAKGYKILIDKNVLNWEWVDISSGDPKAGIELRAEDLVNLLRGGVHDISE